MEEGIRFVLSKTFDLDGDGSYLRRSSVVLQGSPRAGSLSEHRHQSSELWRPVYLAARQQPRQLHEAGNCNWDWDYITISLFCQIEMNGLTGKIKFDQRGQRSDFELDIIELKRDGLTRVRNVEIVWESLQCSSGWSLEGADGSQHDQELHGDHHGDCGESTE